MAIAWPSFLPKALRAGYGFEPAETVIRTEFEGGPVRVRKVTPRGPETIPVRWIFSGAEMEFFKAFYAYALADGSALLDLPLMTNGAAIEVQTVNFASPPRYALVGVTHWEVSAAVQTRRPKIMPEDILIFVTSVGGPDAFSQAVNDVYIVTNITTLNG